MKENGGLLATWWVNQGSTYKEELELSKLWAPLRTRPSERRPIGATQAHWERLLEANPGDFVIHYAKNAIRAWSRVVDVARPAERPYEFSEWERDGRQLVIKPVELELAIPLDQIDLEARRRARHTGTPFTVNGAVQLGYFYRLEGDIETWLLEAVVGAQSDESPSETPARAQEFYDYQGDTRAQTLVRGEQKWLRSRLFPHAGPYDCELCGRSLPAAVLVAAHIKPRAQTTDRERQSARIAMRACALGCDILFERGYVVVDDDGVITPGPRTLGLTPDLRSFRAALISRRCSAFDHETVGYFRAHRRWHNQVQGAIKSIQHKRNEK